MSTSSSTNFSLSRNEIISHALSVMGRLGAGQTANSDDVTLCATALNLMVKTWQNHGMHLWTRTEGTLYLTAGTAKYSFGASTLKAAKTTVETTLSAAEATGQTTLSVTSSTGMAASDICYVELDDDTLQTTTISSIPDSTSIIIADALTSAAASGNSVYTFTTRLGRVLDILDIRIEDASGISHPPLTKVSHQDYFAITNKTSTGTPNKFYYYPQVSTGYLYLWPTPEDVAHRARITYLRQIEDFDASTDDPDFPQEWVETLVYNLAHRLSRTFGVAKDKRDEIALDAARLLEGSTSFDNESASSFFIPG